MKLKHLKFDFSDIEHRILIPGDKNSPAQLFHGTPATVIRNLDRLELVVRSIFYDGDRNGFVVEVNINNHTMKLYPGTYRTSRLFLWNEKTEKLEFFALT